MDIGIDQHLIAGPEAIPLILVLVKRTELINRCLTAFGCPDPIDKDVQPEYQRMLDPGGRLSPGPGQVALLQNTYETYIHWALESPDALREGARAHAERCGVGLGQNNSHHARLFSGPTNYAPVTSLTFWQALPPVDGKQALQVDGAYTEVAWKQSILPFLQRVGESVPEVEPLLNDFQARYRAQYFEQWERFFSGISERRVALSRTRENRRQLAVKLLDVNSPYNRILDVAYNQLKPLLPIALPIETSPTDGEGNPPQQPPHLLRRNLALSGHPRGKGEKGMWVKRSLLQPLLTNQPFLPGLGYCSATLSLTAARPISNL